jgi:hypothetical protein
LTATAASSSRINLKWSDKALNETGQVIERAVAGTGPFAVITTLGSNITTYANTGLSPNTQYYYRIKSTNTAGTSTYSNVASAKTLVAPANAVSNSEEIFEERLKKKETSLTIHPNPARLNATIAFSVDVDQQVQLEIYDVHGKLVVELYNGQAKTGKSFVFKWNTGSQVAGTYFTVLTTRNKVLSKKFVLLR